MKISKLNITIFQGYKSKSGTDMQTQQEIETGHAIVQASNLPLSIIVLGVGDDPFKNKLNNDSELRQGQLFQNVSYINFN